ncbi:hypothetical protein TSTA_109000 [Talaromyces stipitatus ATCC 10500]|uniref:Uncharacterized protein n=1 Tax=Talaromyces stipitatus (strain ATCC 10500 / CBS 375.48 / QM 6759 / NRRL 1006) TaxID=441959 RepID=B8MUQ2_TALSN|nr:uncharacterized protein TSTA_109000 [Talaromyces stipitatus ATCC 10500]EED11719.1 hypothetical protein TSTA_109000 [Talaromyces stipitatus ATCC 10500]
MPLRPVNQPVRADIGAFAVTYGDSEEQDGNLDGMPSMRTNPQGDRRRGDKKRNSTTDGSIFESNHANAWWYIFPKNAPKSGIQKVFKKVDKNLKGDNKPTEGIARPLMLPNIHLKFNAARWYHITNERPEGLDQLSTSPRGRFCMGRGHASGSSWVRQSSCKWRGGFRVVPSDPNHMKSQASYIDKIANLADKRGTYHTPMEKKELFPYQQIASKSSIHKFQIEVGSLMYAALSTRVDIAFAVSRLSRFLTNPGPEHHEASDRVLCYFKQYRSRALQLGGADTFVEASDVSFEDNTLDRKSSQAYVMYLFGGAGLLYVPALDVRELHMLAGVPGCPGPSTCFRASITYTAAQHEQLLINIPESRTMKGSRKARCAGD